MSFRLKVCVLGGLGGGLGVLRFVAGLAVVLGGAVLGVAAFAGAWVVAAAGLAGVVSDLVGVGMVLRGRRVRVQLVVEVRVSVGLLGWVGTWVALGPDLGFVSVGAELFLGLGLGGIKGDVLADVAAGLVVEVDPVGARVARPGATLAAFVCVLLVLADLGAVVAAVSYVHVCVGAFVLVGSGERVGVALVGASWSARCCGERVLFGPWLWLACLGAGGCAVECLCGGFFCGGCAAGISGGSRFWGGFVSALGCWCACVGRGAACLVWWFALLVWLQAAASAWAWACACRCSAPAPGWW
ncbi:hypothetical protein [Sphingomonas gellani]|uniref:hypothetical protein n=1 Tax=Sphingomonas gellani TaxID=1166340 RepID=UPI00147AC4DF|nr:hypothetical protein [Sphingomonas gellani]